MPSPISDKPSVREWTEYYYRETIELEPRVYENALFRECVITKARGATLVNCCLRESKFHVQNVEDMRGFTITLDCYHFGNVELSEAAFDYFVLLLIRGRGNTEKRLKLIEALGGKHRVAELLSAVPEPIWG